MWVSEDNPLKKGNPARMGLFYYILNYSLLVKVECPKPGNAIKL